jgi:hypothetical protein
MHKIWSRVKGLLRLSDTIIGIIAGLFGVYGGIKETIGWPKIISRLEGSSLPLVRHAAGALSLVVSKMPPLSLPVILIVFAITIVVWIILRRRGFEKMTFETSRKLDRLGNQRNGEKAMAAYFQDYDPIVMQKIVPRLSDSADRQYIMNLRSKMAGKGDIQRLAARLRIAI